MFGTEMSAACGSSEGAMTAACASNDRSNVMTSAPLEQQKQWWPLQQDVASASAPASMHPEAAHARGSESAQNPNAAVSAINHSTSSRTPARRRWEIDIRSHCNMVEWAIGRFRGGT